MSPGIRSFPLLILTRKSIAKLDGSSFPSGTVSVVFASESFNLGVTRRAPPE